MNLFDDPWISVSTVDGRVELVGVREALVRAHELRGLAGDCPTQDFVVLRLLVAVLARAAAAAGIEDPARVWWGRDVLPAEVIEPYCEDWRDRFGLFDPEQPFLQVPDLEVRDGDTQPATALLPEIPAARPLFTMGTPGGALEAAEAARWLLHVHGYDVAGIKGSAIGDPRAKAGRVYGQKVGWAGTIGGLVVKGATLLETLLWQLPEVVDATDRPVWEDDEPLQAGPRKAPSVGPVALMVWPARRVRLLRAPDGMVRAVVIAAGEVPLEPSELALVESMTGWRRVKPPTGPQVLRPAVHRPGTALWRRLGAVLAEGRAERVGEFMAAGSIARMRDLDADAGPVTVRAVGMVYGGAAASFLQTEVVDELVLYPQLAASGSAGRDVAVEVIGRVDRAVAAVGQLGRNLVEAAGGGPDAGAAAAAEARRAGFAAVDPVMRRWLAGVVEDPERLPGIAVEGIAAARAPLQALGRRMLAEVTPRARQIRVGAEAGRSVGAAERWWTRELFAQLPLPETVGADVDEIETGIDEEEVVA